MKKLMFLFYVISAVVCLAFSALFDVKTWKDLLKNLICSFLGASLIILIGAEFKWSPTKVLFGIIVASGYARPIVYGVNRQLKEFFKDPKAYIDKYKGNL